MRGGYLGVSLFFTLSGFLITRNLLAEHDRHGSIRLRSFWGRRARRLLPASWLTVFVVTATASVMYAIGRTIGFRPVDALAALTSLSNVAVPSSGQQLCLGVRLTVTAPALLELGDRGADLPLPASDRRRAVAGTAPRLASSRRCRRDRGGRVVPPPDRVRPRCRPDVLRNRHPLLGEILVGVLLAVWWQRRPAERSSGSAPILAFGTLALEFFVALCVTVPQGAQALTNGLLPLVAVTSTLVVAAGASPTGWLAVVGRWRPCRRARSGELRRLPLPLAGHRGAAVVRCRHWPGPRRRAAHRRGVVGGDGVVAAVRDAHPPGTLAGAPGDVARRHGSPCNRRPVRVRTVDAVRRDPICCSHWRTPRPTSPRSTPPHRPVQLVQLDPQPCRRRRWSVRRRRRSTLWRASCQRPRRSTNVAPTPFPACASSEIRSCSVLCSRFIRIRASRSSRSPTTSSSVVALRRSRSRTNAVRSSAAAIRCRHGRPRSSLARSTRPWCCPASGSTSTGDCRVSMGSVYRAMLSSTGTCATPTSRQLMPCSRVESMPCSWVRCPQASRSNGIDGIDPRLADARDPAR